MNETDDWSSSAADNCFRTLGSAGSRCPIFFERSKQPCLKRETMGRTVPGSSRGILSTNLAVFSRSIRVTREFEAKTTVMCSNCCNRCSSAWMGATFASVASAELSNRSKSSRNRA